MEYVGSDNDSSYLQDGQTSLKLAAKKGHIDIVVYLQRNGVNVNAGDTTVRNIQQIDNHTLFVNHRHLVPIPIIN